MEGSGPGSPASSGALNHRMPGPVSRAAIIAGGASQRMGRNKALLRLDGEFLITRVARVLRPLFEEVIVVARSHDIAHAAQLLLIPDTFSGKGPLDGIHAALEYFQSPTFCVACDLPFLRADVITFLCARFQNHERAIDVLAPRVKGRMETLHAIYTPSCLPVIKREMQNERVRSAERVLASLRLQFVEEGELREFDADLKFLTNVNTPADAERAGFSL